MCEWTPPCETSPSRWTFSPRSNGAAQSASFSKSSPVSIARFTRTRSWTRIAARADRQVADLGVAHLAGGQADCLARGGERRVRELAPEPVEDRRVGELDRVARARRRDAPAVEDDERYERDTCGRLAYRLEGVDVERGAADERAVDVRLREQLAGVVGLDRAAVEDRRVEERLDERVRVLRHLGRRGAAGADRPDRLVGEHEAVGLRLEHRRPGGGARPRSRPPRAPPASRRRTRSRRARRRARRARARATVSSVSPKYCRRSEWPTSEPATPSSSSIGAEISPVYAPSRLPVDVLRVRRQARPRRRRAAGERRADDVDVRGPSRASARDPARGTSSSCRRRSRLILATGSPPRRAAPCPRAARGSRRRRSRPTRSRSARPSSFSARTESAPPTTENASSFAATASATAFVPSAKRGHSKTPIGPFQKIVRASAIRAAKRVARLGADVEPEPARRAARRRRRRADSASSANAAAPTTSIGSSTSKSSGFSSRSCSAILPPISTVSARPPRLLRARRACRRPSRRRRSSTNGRSTSPSSVPRCSSSVEQQQPGVGRQQVRDAPRSTRARGAPSRTRRST